jgi:cell division protein FtsN
MIKRIENETKLNDAKIKKIANNKFRVILGPYYNLNSLQSAFNDIKILEFENIEIIKND